MDVLQHYYYGAVVDQLVEEPVQVQAQLCLTPINVSLSKIFNPKLLLVAGQYPMWKPRSPVCECVSVSYTVHVKRFDCLKEWKTVRYTQSINHLLLKHGLRTVLRQYYGFLFYYL